MQNTQHPDDAAVDALATAMKAKLAKQRAKGYGGWDTDCTQQRLSDMLRTHVEMGDPVDVANFCAFLLARGEAIAAAQQAVQAAVPLFWVRLLRDGLYEGPVHNNSASGKLLRDEKPGEWHPLYLHAAPAHPAEGVPAQCPNINEPRGCWRVACQLGGKCREPERSATQPAAQGVDAGKLLAEKHTGMKVDYRGLLGQVQREIERSAPGHAEMLRQLQGHLQELGQRWYAGDTAVVDELLQLYCVERQARAALAAQAKKGGA